MRAALCYHQGDALWRRGLRSAFHMSRKIMSASEHGIATWLIVATVAAGWTNLASGQERRPQQRAEIAGVVKSVDAGTAKITITLPGSGGRDLQNAKEAEDKT